MTCRIDRGFGDDGIVILSISGRITKHDLDILRNAIEAEASAVAIDLENVDLVDREIVKFLAQKELSGSVLRNCSPYIREWVTRDRTEMLKASGDIEDA
jgi:anti-anti-sigma regulatory factor